MRTRGILFIILFSLFCSVFSQINNEETWTGEWGVHIEDGNDIQFLQEMGFTIIKQIGNLQNTYLVKHKEVTARHSLAQITNVDVSLQNHPNIIFSAKQTKKMMQKKTSVSFADPLYPNQWHLNNNGQNDGTIGEDVHIVDAWNEGYNGQGVRIAIVDDGFQHIHPDLMPRYKPDTSYNINDETPDPSPGQWDWHGTSAAGVALAANDSVCGVGAAYMADGSGIRLLGDLFSDTDTAAALIFGNDLNHIYSNSWGPSDDGMTVEGPGYFTQQAIDYGLNNGRNKLGSIFVWAAGNGNQYKDNCNYDGFANHRGTIAVGAIDNTGKQSYYSEPCAAMLVTAPSSFRNSQSKSIGITTTDILGENGYSTDDCTANFGGTSSACPLVSGIIALMLQANPDLTWRDVQEILVTTADKNDETDSDWTTNGAGFHINHKYGFGRVNAYKAVTKALEHENVSKSKQKNYPQNVVNSTIPDNQINGINNTIKIKDNLLLEHVEVTVHIPNFYSSGDLQIVLISPSGTKSVLSEVHGIIKYIALNLDDGSDATEYTLAASTFGPSLNDTPINGNIVIPQFDSLLCDEVANITNCADLQGNVALLDYNVSICNFATQVFNAQTCGATAVLFASILSIPFSPFGTNSSVSIPSFMAAIDASQRIKDQIQNNTILFANIQISGTTANISYDGWTFSTVRNWGEKSKGEWTLQMIDMNEGGEAHFASWDLTIYGRAVPAHVPYWVIGVVVGVIIVVIFVIAIVLYRRDKRRQGYNQM